MFTIRTIFTRNIRAHSISTYCTAHFSIISLSLASKVNLVKIMSSVLLHSSNSFKASFLPALNKSCSNILITLLVFIHPPCSRAPDPRIPACTSISHRQTYRSFLFHLNPVFPASMRAWRVFFKNAKVIYHNPAVRTLIYYFRHLSCSHAPHQAHLIQSSISCICSHFRLSFFKLLYCLFH